MTKEQIIKALRACAGVESCNKCQYRLNKSGVRGDGCYDRLMRDAADALEEEINGRTDGAGDPAAD